MYNCTDWCCARIHCAEHTLHSIREREQTKQHFKVLCFREGIIILERMIKKSAANDLCAKACYFPFVRRIN